VSREPRISCPTRRGSGVPRFHPTISHRFRTHACRAPSQGLDSAVATHLLGVILGDTGDFSAAVSAACEVLGIKWTDALVCTPNGSQQLGAEATLLLKPLRDAVTAKRARSSGDGDDSTPGGTPSRCNQAWPLRMTGDLVAGVAGETAGAAAAAAGAGAGAASTTKHCPPEDKYYEDLLCNCVTAHNYPGCVCAEGGEMEDFLADERAAAAAKADADRKPNNSQRYRCYRASSHRINGIGEQGVRHPLPTCLVQAIRWAWPEASGVYVGFKHA
jgi:hypothetical protein